MKIFLVILIIGLAALVRKTETGGQTHLAPFICSYSHDFYNPDRSYKKSLCWISDATAYVDAQGICRHGSMELFAIWDESDYQAIQSTLTPFFGSSSNESLWINGLQNKNGSWVTYTPKRHKLYSEITPNIEYSVDSRCLLWSNRNGGFAAYPTNCWEIHSLVCEYDRSILE
jgi:hypothetical protein